MSVRVAIIGAGWMGETHAGAITAAGDRVAVIIDPDHRRAGALAAIHGATVAAELDGAADCDAAVIATPSWQHREQATQLADLGVPMLVEKPHRLPGQSPEPLRAALTRSGVHCQIGMTTRFHPGIQALHAALRAGQLGELLCYHDRYGFQLVADTLPAWYFDPAKAGGGVVVTNGVHLIDRASWLLDEALDLVDVRAMLPVIDGHAVEDHAEIRLAGQESAQGVTISLLWTTAPCAPPELVVTGTDGHARIGLDRWSIETLRGSQSGVISATEAAFEAQWADFRRALLPGDDRPSGPDFETLETTLDLIEQIYRLGTDSDP